MGKTSIEWTDASWNPVVGCTEVSPGCANCYAARLTATRLRNLPDYKGLTRIGNQFVSREPGIEHTLARSMMRWTGEVRTLPHRLSEPQKWRTPRRIFVCDMGDLFHESVPHGFLVEVFRAMAAAPQHTYQILTKRAERMRDWLTSFELVEKHHPLRAQAGVDGCRWPWPNVWCGVSVENQHFADERIPLLLATPAAVRWISAEPLLGPVKLYQACEVSKAPEGWGRRLNWVVCGGESGQNARPMHPDWARSLRDQCQAAGVPFFFKQWGEFAPCEIMCGNAHVHESIRPNGVMAKLGKKKAGRLLDGRTWDEFPTFVKWEGVMR